MYKKITILSLLAVFILTSGFGCKLANKKTKQATKPIVITYWRVFDGPDAFAKIIDKYNCLNLKDLMEKILNFQNLQEEKLLLINRGEYDKKKKYTEQTFEEIKKMMQQGAEYQSKPMTEQDEDYETEYEWSKPVVKVKNLKETKTINGFSCQHYLASVTTVGTHIETGIKDTMLFVSDLWNAKNVSKKMDLVYDFNKRYMKAIGFDIPEIGRAHV